MFIILKGELININSIKKIWVDEESIMIEWEFNAFKTKIKCGSAEKAQGEYNSFMEYLKKKELIYNFPL